ncbi:MAG: hypothetical protein VW709_09450 [Rickettsiales bacterium]
MPPKNNPKKLNKLQLKTLAILQEFAETDLAGPGENEGEMRIGQIPRPHMDHFHVANGVVLIKDAVGLNNRGVWAALDRKGLIRTGVFPLSITLTPEGLSYETGVKAEIVHGSDH